MSENPMKRRSSERGREEGDRKQTRGETSLLTPSFGATVEQAEDHQRVTTAGRAEDSILSAEAPFERVEDLDLVATDLSRTQLWNMLRHNKKKYEAVDIQYIQSRLPTILRVLGSSVASDLNDEEKNELCRSIRVFYFKYEERWLKGSYQIRQKDKEWTESLYEIPAKFKSRVDSINVGEDEVIEQHQTSFADLNPRTQQRHVQKMKQKIAGEDVSKILRAVASEVKDQSATSIPVDIAKDTEYVLKVMARSPSKPKKIADMIRKSKEDSTPMPYSPQEALAVIIDHGITKEAYTWLQRDMARRNFKAFPSYTKVQNEKKKCHPENEIQVNEYCASVSLQSLLEHTIKRIIEVQEPEDDQKVFTNYMSFKGIKEITCTLHASWGFDGSSCQSRYKQKFKNRAIEEEDDQNMLATTIIPLRLVSDLCPNTPFWENCTPQSVRYCRPLRLQFVKETPTVILNEFNWVEDQIEELHGFSVSLKNGYKVHVNFNLHLTLIDGKVLSHITRTSSYQVCPICKATPKDMNDLDKMRSMKVIEANTQFGLSPLHAWIRVLEFLLHLGYKNELGLQKAVLRKTPQVKKQLEIRKKTIQNEIQRETGLIVDQPKSGGCGTTNDGNTARRALSTKNRAKIAQALGIEMWLLEDFHTILSVISSGLEIDSNKFGKFCDDLAKKFVSKYSWYRMPVTIHKILIHGKYIIEKLSLPVGMLSEQAAESRHRLFRLYRTKHSYRGDREIALREIFQRSLEASDPVISGFRLYERQKQLKRQPLSPAAVNLLRPVAFSEELDEDSSVTPNDHLDFNLELVEDGGIVLSEEEYDYFDERDNDDVSA